MRSQLQMRSLMFVQNVNYCYSITCFKCLDMCRLHISNRFLITHSRSASVIYPYRAKASIYWPGLSVWVASGCVVECRICNRQVAGSNLGLGYFAPRSTQPSIPPGSVNEYQLRLGRQRQVWLMDEHGCAGKTVKSLRTRAIPERFCGGD